MKEMTASEILRDCARRSTRPELAAAEYYFPETYVDDYTCDLCSLFRALADKIDAELADARNESLLQGAQVWAKANGWPGFRDGEDFGQWLARCALPRPRFEDGEPVQFGDDTDELHGVEKFIFTRSCGGSCQMQDADGNMLTVFPGGFVKRPATEALGADGLPIKACETMWSLSGTGPHTVDTVYTDIPTPDGRDCPWVDIDNDGTWACAESLTHTPPDTQERIDRDAALPAREYYARHIGHDVAEKGAVEVHAAVTAHLLKRQRELDAKGAI